MWHLRFRGLAARLLESHRSIQRKNVVAIFCLILFAGVLASCGSVTTGQASPATLAPTFAPSPAVTSSHTPVPTPTATVPTPKPTSPPAIAPQPTQSPPAPAILDLRPLSMSFVGHLDCQNNGAYVCLARVLSGSSNQSDLHWTAFTNVPGHIVFSPASGVLAPGQSVLVSITIPLNACTPGLFFFRGPVNTHTITWAC
ncbi:MAG TPA: hypothetical protein VKR83_05870 [Ktedonobacteraceae bacterium]|nr:hypothetical protein [Ktedonobacteraceae bacterium]